MLQKLNNSPLRFIRYIPDAICYVALCGIVLLEASQVIARYVFRHPIVFVDDAVCLCFAWVIYFGCAVAYRYGMHYGLDFIYKVIPEKAHPYYNIFLKLVILFLVSVLFKLSYILRSNVGAKVLLTTGIPYKYIDDAAVLGFALMVIYSIQFIIHDIIVIVNNKKAAKEVTE